MAAESVRRVEKVDSKRKKVVLSIEEKLDILELIEKGTSYTIITEKYGIGKSTVTDIKKSKHKLEAFKKKKPWIQGSLKQQ